MSAIQPAIRSALQPAIRSAILSYGAAAWSPTSLFAASEVGVWYDPSDFSTMFQDSAGTTPVTAVGDPVGKILDKSGNGKHATQATAASRPILRNDGTNYYLEFDGVDNSLATAAIDFSATDKITHHAGWTQSTASFGVVTELSNNPGPNAGTFSLAGYTAGEMFFVARGTAALTAKFDAATLPKTRVSTGLLDIAQALAADEIVARVNGVVKPVLGYIDAGPAGTGNFGNYPLYLGRRGGIQYPLSGRIYSIVIRGALSDAAQIAAAEAYVAGKSGVTL